jgi:TorA maturation chaperone TorD
LSLERAANRRGLLIRSDTLFTDAIEQLLSGFPELDMAILDVQQGYETIPELQPEIIIVDESLPSQALDRVLALARGLRECRVIMLNPGRNDFVLVNSQRATVKEVGDLMNAIRGDVAGIDHDTSSADHLQRATEAHLRAGMYGFLARMFNHRPDMEFVRRLRVLGVDAFTFSTENELSPDVAQGLQEMGSFIEATSADPVERVEENLGVDWTRLFRGVRPGYGPPPPYEGVYSEGEADQTDVLQSIMRIYHEHSVDLDEKAGNRPDYIGIELDFLRHLSECEAEAWEQEKDENALEYQDAEKHFLINHLGRWVWKFCDLAIEEAKTDFYRGFIRLTKGVMNEEINPSNSFRYFD